MAPDDLVLRARRFSDQKGAPAVEFALVMPVFLLLVLGALACGIYFGATHSIQQLAADAARITVTGLTLSCPARRPDLGQASFAVRPGVLRLAVGDIAPGSFLDTAQPLTVVCASIVTIATIARITARAEIASIQTNPPNVHFTHADVVNGTAKTVATTTPVASLTTSLISNLDLKLELLGANLLGGLLNGVVGTVQSLLNPLGPALDTVLVNLFGVLGLSVGEADVKMHGFDCRSAALVR